MLLESQQWLKLQSFWSESTSGFCSFHWWQNTVRLNLQLALSNKNTSVSTPDLQWHWKNTFFLIANGPFLDFKGIADVSWFVFCKPLYLLQKWWRLNIEVCRWIRLKQMLTICLRLYICICDLLMSVENILLYTLGPKNDEKWRKMKVLHPQNKNP